MLLTSRLGKVPPVLQVIWGMILRTRTSEFDGKAFLDGAIQLGASLKNAALKVLIQLEKRKGAAATGWTGTGTEVGTRYQD